MSPGTSSSRVGEICQSLAEGCRPSTGIGGPLTSLTRRGFGRMRRTCSVVVERHTGKKGSCKGGCKCNSSRDCSCKGRGDSCNCKAVSPGLRTTTGCVGDEHCERTVGALSRIRREDTV